MSALVFSFISISFAQIQTGNSEANVNVETNIQGNGNAKTHIEVDVNGEKKVLNASGNGTYKVEVKSEDKNSKPSVLSLPTFSSSSSSQGSTKPLAIQKPSFAPNLISIIKTAVEDFIKRIFNSLKLDKSF